MHIFLSSSLTVCNTLFFYTGESSTALVNRVEMPKGMSYDLRLALILFIFSIYFRFPKSSALQICEFK